MKISREKAAAGTLDTYVGEDTSFEGILTSSMSLTIYGSVKGTIECQGRVVIGQGSNIEADIAADDVTVSGKVVGNVTAKSKLEITSTGIIEGDIKTGRLITEDGGKLDGHCEMLSDGKSTVAEKSEAEEKPGTRKSEGNAREATQGVKR